MLHRKVRFYATYLIIIMKIRHNIIFSNHWLISGIVRTVCVCIFTVIGLSSASAQVYSTAQRGTPYNSYSNETYGSSYNSTTDMQQAQPTYNSYQSTVYQPFESSVPSYRHSTFGTSSYSNSGSYNPIRGRRNTGEEGGTDTNNPNNDPGGGETPDGWEDSDHPSDPGHQSNQSPIGEAWVMLLFAATAALVVFIRQRKAAVRGESPTSNSQ